MKYLNGLYYNNIRLRMRGLTGEIYENREQKFGFFNKKGRHQCHQTGESHWD
ncbi:hypothetical protein EBME_2312 [bacterium endosymbiont of Mortierella elongata FMR23-6]|nr:hypothetical protein EBME_2312 [bacterium endosymbiont of Mortierella elongata FMR23-6]